MTDTSPGPDWWRASDGNLYPPHLHPDARAAVATEPPEPTGAPVARATHEPIDWEKLAAERAARHRKAAWRHRAKLAGATLVAFGAIVIAFALTRGRDERPTLSGTSTTVAPTTTVVTTTADTAPPDSTGVIATTVSVFDLEPGSCVDDNALAPGLVTDVTVVPCEQPHSHEVYHRVTYAGPTQEYDAAALRTFASDQCTQSFATYVGLPYDRSRYYYLQLAPSEDSWNDSGDRDVVCLLFLQGSQLTGSARATGQ